MYECCEIIRIERQELIFRGEKIETKIHNTKPHGYCTTIYVLCHADIGRLLVLSRQRMLTWQPIRFDCRAPGVESFKGNDKSIFLCKIMPFLEENPPTQTLEMTPCENPLRGLHCWLVRKRPHMQRLLVQTVYS